MRACEHQADRPRACVLPCPALPWLADMFNRRNEFNGRTPENSNFVFASGAHMAVVWAWLWRAHGCGVGMAVHRLNWHAVHAQSRGCACCSCLPQLQAQPHHSHPAAADPAAPEPLQSTLSPTAAAGAT